MFVLGLTGSIGMGKSTVSGFFKEANIPVWDADSTVHKLYSPGGKAVEAVGKEFPAAVVEGGINRAELSKYVVGNQVALKLLESIVHPLVADDRNTFLAQAVQEGHKLAVVDIPLLYESGGGASVDAVAVVSAPEEVQRARVLARPGMTQEKLEAILARQVPDAEKRKRADFIIDAGTSLEATRQAVSELISQLQCREGRVMRARAEPSAAL